METDTDIKDNIKEIRKSPEQIALDKLCTGACSSLSYEEIMKNRMIIQAKFNTAGNLDMTNKVISDIIPKKYRDKIIYVNKKIEISGTINYELKLSDKYQLSDLDPTTNNTYLFASKRKLYDKLKEGIKLK